MAIQHVATQDFGEHHKGDVVEDIADAPAHCIVKTDVPDPKPQTEPEAQIEHQVEAEHA